MHKVCNLRSTPFTEICVLWFTLIEDHGGGQVVSVLAFLSEDPNSNPADVYSFSVKFMFEKNENK